MYPRISRQIGRESIGGSFFGPRGEARRIVLPPLSVTKISISASILSHSQVKATVPEMEYPKSTFETRNKWYLHFFDFCHASQAKTIFAKNNATFYANSPSRPCGVKKTTITLACVF